MKRNVFAMAAVVASAFALEAKDCKFTVDPHGIPMVSVAKDFPGFGYVDDPVIGGEEVALKYRHAGAWVLRTSKCDNETMEFLKRYDIKLILLVDGKREEIAADFKRIQDGGYAGVIAGVQLGTKADGGGDAESEKWRAVAAQVSRRFPKARLAIPAVDAKPKMMKMLAEHSRKVTHLIYDLTNTTAPYKKLKEFTRQIVQGSNSDLKRTKIWVIAPDRLPGTPEAERDSFPMMSWKIHWMMSAYAVEKVDTVLFNQPVKDNEFGYTLRYVGQAFRDHPIVLSHGESLTMDTAKAPDKDNSPDLDQDFDDLSGGYGGEENMTIVASPKACANVAAKKSGDVEYLALMNGGKDRICLVMVNTIGKKTRVTCDIKKLKSGNSTYRRMFVDSETGKVKREAMGNYSQPGLPFTAVIDPNCIETVTFILTSRNYNQAGY